MSHFLICLLYLGVVFCKTVQNSLQIISSYFGAFLELPVIGISVEVDLVIEFTEEPVSDKALAFHNFLLVWSNLR